MLHLTILNFLKVNVTISSTEAISRNFFGQARVGYNTKSLHKVLSFLALTISAAFLIYKFWVSKG